MNLTSSNEEKKIAWKLEYQTNEKPYLLPDLSLDSFKDLVTKFSKDETLF